MVLEFFKYTKAQCLETYLKMYDGKITEVINDGKLMIHCFNESLDGLAFSWYMGLDGFKII